MISEKEHYVYMYLREDGTPYYIGKGKGNRAFSKNHKIYVPPVERIVFVKSNLSDSESKKIEIDLITQYGRKDLGTGILRNKTNGGDGGDTSMYFDSTKISDSVTKTKNDPLWKETVGKAQGQKMAAYYQDSEWCKTTLVERIEKQKNTTSNAEWLETVGKEMAAKCREAKLKNNPGFSIIVECEHCGNKGQLAAMKRWHFDNCKHRNVND